MSGPSSVLHVIATLDRAGTEMVCLELTRGLQALGVHNHVAALRDGGGAIVPEITATTGPPTRLSASRIARLWSFYRLLRRTGSDAVIFHFFTLDQVLMGLLARICGVRRLISVQGNPAQADPGLRRKLRVILWASRLLGLKLVSVSRYIEATMQAIGPLPRGSGVIHNGCHTADISRRAAAVRSASAEAVILMVARLDRIKDHATLLRAVARMPEYLAGRRIVLELVGQGALLTDLKALAADEGISDRVRFLGRRADVPEHLGRSAVFCLSTTRDEGFGVVLIEALAAGVPVVASDVPACSEVLERGALGRLVPPATPDALAEALIDAVERGKDTPTLTEVAQRYDVSTMAQSYLKILSQ